MIKKIKLFGLPEFGSLRGSTSASLKIGEILAIRKNWQGFGTGGRTYFALLADRFITYTNKIGSSATRAFPRDANIICTDTYIHARKLRRVKIKMRSEAG